MRKLKSSIFLKNFSPLCQYCVVCISKKIICYLYFSIHPFCRWNRQSEHDSLAVANSFDDRSLLNTAAETYMCNSSTEDIVEFFAARAHKTQFVYLVERMWKTSRLNATM